MPLGARKPIISDNTNIPTVPLLIIGSLMVIQIATSDWFEEDN